MHGHSVRLFDFDSYPGNINAIRKQDGIYSEGELEGFARIEYAGHEIGKALDGADIIYVVGPAYSTRPFAEACKPHLRKGQLVIVCPGSCMGSVEFMNGAQLSLQSDSVIVAETSTLPYAVRILEPGRIHVFLKLKDGLFIAAIPARRLAFVMGKIQDVYPALKIAKNVLQTSLQNGNPAIHPSVTMLNAALIERTGGDFLFYEDGVTPAVGRLIKAIDLERIAIGRKLNVDIMSDPDIGYMQGYMAEATYDKGYSEAPGFKGIKAQSSLDYRYFHEDAGYGLVFWHSLAKQIGVETRCISAVILLASVLMERDYLAEGKRTMKSLGLAEYTAAELEQLLT
jgi:opine dehydrogenase